MSPDDLHPVEEEVDDDDAVALDIAGAYDVHPHEHPHHHNAAGNKWARNGFGQPVAEHGTAASGKFSPEESEVVRRAIEDYCTAKNIAAARLCSECDHKAELKGAWMEIAQRLPQRSVQSVYRHGIRQLHPFRRGAWSPEECRLLQELVQRLGKKWAAIQGRLNRSADSCRDKYREMSEDFVKGRWKEQEIDQFKGLIREFLNVAPDTDMRDLGRIVEEQDIQMPWSTISKRMSKRSRLSCFKKWQKLIAPRAPSEADADEPPAPKRPRVAVAASPSAAPGEPPLHPHQHHSPFPTTHHHQHHHHQPHHPLDLSGGAGPGVGASVAAAAAAAAEAYDVYSAKIAAETVEAVDLPTVHIPGATIHYDV